MTHNYVFAMVPLDSNMAAVLMASANGDSGDADATVATLGRMWKNEEWASIENMPPNMPPPSKSTVPVRLEACRWIIPALLAALSRAPDANGLDAFAPVYSAVPWDGALTWMVDTILQRASPGRLSQRQASSLLDDEEDVDTCNYALLLSCRMATFDETALATLLERGCAQLTAIAIGRRMPLCWRADSQNPKRVPATDAGWFGSMAPLSLLNMVQTRLVESSECPPFSALPEDVAAPLAFAIWQRACAAPPLADYEADRLVKVARYWGLDADDDTDPQRLCVFMVDEALKRKPAQSHAVPVPYRMPVPTGTHDIDIFGALLTIQDDGALGGASDQCGALRAAGAAFSQYFERPPVAPRDDPLLGAVAALLIDPPCRLPRPHRRRSCTALRARLALLAVCKDMRATAADLTTVLAARRLFQRGIHSVP
ncbi:hypothetical protein pneo_cds_685 [Pandoravirus neocaledonia]|uniref:Uncharacterized protein n=1 Tax=Pandoravirus neocaledonia TaxID=2107708 RepID=A0A2U7UD16_9VIRU|nr:hypothetical protein pneo_cds_685 [Pandoravirus neocaledonia]AVK76292.1 hypothetical protein pneo_cds_685 [Pandoravirus neocaledonia]